MRAEQGRPRGRGATFGPAAAPGTPARKSVSASSSSGSLVRWTVLRWCTWKCASRHAADWNANFAVVSVIPKGVFLLMSSQPPLSAPASSIAGSLRFASSLLSLLSFRRAAATQLPRCWMLLRLPCLSGTWLGLVLGLELVLVLGLELGLGLGLG